MNSSPNYTPWGYHLHLDLYDCDPTTIRSKDEIYNYSKAIVNLIDMKAFGEPIIVWFGEDPTVGGFTLVQLIETSLISGHFVELTNKCYIDIFSCKTYDTAVAKEFTQKFFSSKHCISNFLIRK